MPDHQTPDPTPDPLEDLDALFGAWEAGDFDADIDRPTSGEAARLAGIARSLGSAHDVALLDPPRDLRDRVLERVRAEASTIGEAGAPVAPIDLGRARGRREQRGAGRDDDGVGGVRGRQGGMRARPWWARPQLIAAAAAVVLVAGVLGLRPGRSTGDVVFASELIAPPETPDSGAAGKATVVRKGGKTIMRLKATGLTPTKDGEAYQCWFVGPQDTPDSQDRFSVGTFTTEDGSINVEWETAVDLERYPKVGITLEPDDGDPLRNGPKALVSKPEAA